MARLESSREYVGAVDHPKTGELIQLADDHPADVAETVADAYHFLHVEGESEDAGTDDGTPAETDDAETETFRCGVEKANGDPCERTVDTESATCWQH